MNPRRIALVTGVALTAGAVALAPAASAAKPAPKFAVTKLSIVNYKKTVDVATKDQKVRVQVQVKDHSKKFNPTSVKLVVTDKTTGEEKTTFVVNTHLVGKSKKTSNWRGAITVPQGSVDPGQTAVYCIKLVKVNDSDPDTLPAVATAKGLAGRDCFTVVNSTPVPPVPTP